MFEKLRNLPDNVKNILAIIFSIIIIFIVITALTFLNRFFRGSLPQIRDLLTP
jgi:hypothetical protein